MGFYLKCISALAVYLIVALPGFAAIQATYYASPTGSGSTCSQAQPGSLSSVQTLVRSVTASMTGDIVVMLRGGTYTLTSTMAMTAQDGGTNGHNVIYQAYPGETPVISGGQKVTGWTLSDATKNIYRANVGTSVDTRQLYVNGLRATRARSVSGSGWGVTGSGTFTCPSTTVSWGNLSNIEVVIQAAWRLHRSKISSVNGTTATGTGFLTNFGPVGIRWIENAYELLDAPGEWYLNRTTGILYYMPRTGENISSAEVVLAKVETLISGTNVTNLQFNGITFSHATWLSPNTNGVNTMQADNINNGYLSGNINFTSSSNIVFKNNIFTHLGQTALKIASGSHDTIYNNTFQDISGSGIAIGTTGNGSTTTYMVVDNNLIKDCAVEYMGCVGIFALYTENLKLTHNEIRKMPYTGISVGWGWSNTRAAGLNGEIAYNRIDSVMLYLIDGGGIYTLSNQPGTRVHDNYIHMVRSDNGLYPDEGSSHMRWYNNVVSKAPRWLHMWTSTITYDTVENNWRDGGDENLQGGWCIVRNNTLVTGAWPTVPQAIINNAGRVSLPTRIIGQELHHNNSLVKMTINKKMTNFYSIDGKLVSCPVGRTMLKNGVYIVKAPRTAPVRVLTMQ